jgi:hypothetical protein
MKITITLTENEVKALKAYIKESAGVDKPTKEDIKTEVVGMVSSCMQCGALGGYYQQFNC